MSEYTPALARLMEREKVIEQRTTAYFMDVGAQLEAIRDEGSYAAAGYDTFEAYCRGRWNFSSRHVVRMIEAKQTGELIERSVDIGPRGPISTDHEPVPMPTQEAQVRPLGDLPREDRASAWREAVSEASGNVPTAREVRAVVNRRRPPSKDHPATYSDAILKTVAERVRDATRVLDPFAGTGRVHELRELAGVDTIGVELEPEWAEKAPGMTIQGNALALPDDKIGKVDAIVTSPTYGNRMADSHEAKDDSVRLTYTHTLGRKLSEDNSGAMQWGEEYREFHRKAWAESIRVLSPGGRMVINIKDHIRGGVQQDVSAWHVDTLCRGFGMELVGIDVVPTRGLMAGANAETRTLAELIFTFRKPANEAAA